MPSSNIHVVICGKTASKNKCLKTLNALPLKGEITCYPLVSPPGREQALVLTIKARPNSQTNYKLDCNSKGIT